MLKAVKLLVAFCLMLLVTGCAATGTAKAQFDADQGVELVRQLWADMKATNMPEIEEMMAPGFQSIHQDGGRSGDQELALIRNLKLGDYKLTDFKATQAGSVLMVSYFVSVEETIEGKRLSKKPAARLSGFLKTDNGWQWLFHANLRAVK